MTTRTLQENRRLPEIADFIEVDATRKIFIADISLGSIEFVKYQY
jgi:hypothetical protein